MPDNPEKDKNLPDIIYGDYKIFDMSQPLCAIESAMGKEPSFKLTIFSVNGNSPLIVPSYHEIVQQLYMIDCWLEVPPVRNLNIEDLELIYIQARDEKRKFYKGCVDFRKGMSVTIRCYYQSDKIVNLRSVYIFNPATVENPATLSFSADSDGWNYECVFTAK